MSLISDIDKYYQKLIDILWKIPEQDRTKKVIDGTGGKVSAADVIAYQIGWGKRLIEWYEAGVRGEMAVMPGDGFSKWDYTAIAHHFYQKYRYDGFKQQEREFEQVVKRLVSIIEYESQTGNLEKLGVWQWCTLQSGKQWPLAKWIRINTAAPYKRAAQLLTVIEPS